MSDRNDLTRPPVGLVVHVAHWVIPLGRPTGSSHLIVLFGVYPGGSHHIERTSVPESPPVFRTPVTTVKGREGIRRKFR
jgi:hypothetical protein